MLSVAMCTYNGEKYLNLQLDSILNQTKSVNEVIICDDNSNDSTLDILKKFENKYPSIIKLYENIPSLGAIKNFEKAIGLCSGDIIFLSDQDDVWEKNKVEEIIGKFDKNKAYEAVFSDGYLINDKNNLIDKKLFEESSFNIEAQCKWADGKAIIDLINYNNYITGATLAIKKSLYYKAIPFPTINNIWHDAFLGLHAAANSSLGWINKPLIRYRLHNLQQVGVGSTSHGETYKWLSDSKDLNLFLANSKLKTLQSLWLIDFVDVNHHNLEIINTEKKKLIDWLYYVDLRLNLPKNIFLRITTIVKNISIYKLHNSFPLKSILRDIITPCSVYN